jgi:hypothetical protein
VILKGFLDLFAIFLKVLILKALFAFSGYSKTAGAQTG